MATSLRLLAALLICLIPHSQGEQTSPYLSSAGGYGTVSWFQANTNPAEIVFGMEAVFGLNCGLETAANLTSVIMEIKHGQSLVAREDYSDMARPVHSYPSNSQVEVQRKIYPNRVDFSYRWDRPTLAQGGTYTCKIEALDSGHMPHVKIMSKNVVVREPNGTELYSLILNQGEQLNDLLQSSVFLERELINLRRHHNSTASRLSATLEEARHIERGTVQCGNGHKWESNDKDKTKNHEDTVTFSKPYAKPPEMFLTINYMNVFTNRPVRYYTFVESVNTTHAVVICRQYESYGGSRIQWMQVDWLSLPQP